MGAQSSSKLRKVVEVNCKSTQYDRLPYIPLVGFFPRVHMEWTLKIT